uniref:Pre-mRNA-processing factor 19 n=1 Tax=Odontella aurita TaxID=265563 RepID=A0A7S4HRY8_9STRA
MLKCSLSGETPPTDPVVTPSGRICSRRLLLSKMTENGGRDPFDPSGKRALDESDLVSLRTDDHDASAVPPRLPSAGSLPSLLGQIQSEYDALLLELYDARRALEETRRELSQALYQNDAAVRVVARLAMERDAAREKARELSSRVAAQPAVVEEDTRKRRRVEGDGEGVEEEKEVGPAPPPELAEKPAVVEPESAPAAGGEPSVKIPKSDLAAMKEAWTALSKARRKAAKAKKNEAGPALDDFAKFEEVDKKSLHRTNVKAGIDSLAIGGNLVVSCGRDKQAIVYNKSEGKMLATLKVPKCAVTVADIFVPDDGDAAVATGWSDGNVRLYAGSDLAAKGDASVDGTPVVGVSIHPSGKYAVAAVKSGKVGFFSLDASAEAEGIKLVALLGEKDDEGVEYTCGSLHPDGLIFGTGTADGKLLIWDLSSQTLAGTLVVS